jgi:hypothetical protein
MQRIQPAKTGFVEGYKELEHVRMGNVSLVAANRCYSIRVKPNERSALGELHLRFRGGRLPQPRRMWRKQSGWAADGCVCGSKIWLFPEMKMRLARKRRRLRLLP